MRTPYGRTVLAETFLKFACRGYVVASQDCRGTGDSEPDHWDYMVYEPEDSFDFVEWISEQDWFGGFVASCGGSYAGWVQWSMAMHPAMSAIAPEVSAFVVDRPCSGPSHYMFKNAHSRSVGKGSENVAIGYEETERQMVEETLAGGYFNEPLYSPFPAGLIDRYPELSSLEPAEGWRWLHTQYGSLLPAERAELLRLTLAEDRVTSSGWQRLSKIFGVEDLLPCAAAEPYRTLHAPALLITGWYDWGLCETLATWDSLTTDTLEPVRSQSRLLIAPSAHKMPGYHERRELHPELERVYRTEHIVELLLHWYAAVREGVVDAWPAVVYYLMGANEWRAAPTWPPPSTTIRRLYLAADGGLASQAPSEPCEPDRYVYDPEDPTPTVGGSIVSHVYTPGSVDVSEVQRRPDVLTYTTAPLESDLDVVGPIRLILYACSSALDTDFSARLSDVFPDGRALQLQSATVRARYRDPDGGPQLLEPGRVYSFEIDMSATANRFAAGHRIRLDLSSADFPKFDRNANRAGEVGSPIPAEQTIYHDRDHPSHLLLPIST